jgi:hypothetical protein
VNITPASRRSLTTAAQRCVDLGVDFFGGERRALPSILIPSISKAPHHGSAQDACVARRSAFLNLRLRPAKGAVGDYARRFLCRGNANSSCAASQSLHIHSIGLAPWHQFRCMCCRAFCVPKFEFGGPPREWWATMRGIFCAIESIERYFS